MVTRLLPYVDAAIASVPNYGKAHALTFVTSLLAETYLRFSGKKDPNLHMIAGAKSVQTLSGLLANPTFSSSRQVTALTCFLTMLLPSHLLFLGAAKFSTILNYRFQRSNDKYLLETVLLKADRPSFAFLLASANEVANIASKVISSLAVGIIAQQVLTGDKTGKIRTVVSAALLAVSAVNVYCKRKEKPQKAFSF